MQILQYSCLSNITLLNNKIIAIIIKYYFWILLHVYKRSSKRVACTKLDEESRNSCSREPSSSRKPSLIADRHTCAFGSEERKSAHEQENKYANVACPIYKTRSNR